MPLVLPPLGLPAASGLRSLLSAAPALLGKVRPGLLRGGDAVQRRGRRSFVTISSDRLEEFVRAELSLFAERRDRPLQPLLLREILRASADPSQVAKLLHEELPVRFARRIRHIERISGWESIPELVKLHAMHAKSFRELRLADPVAGGDAYPGIISRIRQRHKQVGPLFAEALQRIDRVLIGAGDASGPPTGVRSSVGENSDGCLESGYRLDRRTIEQWAETFLSSRVSTEMQMAHYAACLGASGSAGGSTKIGIIDAQCDPLDIVQQAIAQVQDGLYPCFIETENPCGDIRFCQAPRYLFYIMQELLHNSARATAEAAGQDPAEVERRPIQVSVCANDLQVVIRVSDRGGGMQLGSADQMWSFVSRTQAGCLRGSNDRVEQHSDAEVGAVGSDSEDDGLEAPQRPWGVFAGQSPLSGRGIGLPLSRLYAKYLGGSLEVINMPGLGVDSYLFLTRIDPSEALGIQNGLHQQRS